MGLEDREWSFDRNRNRKNPVNCIARIINCYIMHIQRPPHTSPTHKKMKLTLSDNWLLSFVSPLDHQPHTIPAQVPGNVIGDLQRAGLIPDPFYDCNSVALRPWEFVDWSYQTDFDAPALAPGERLQLRFGGIDTIADILVNGIKVGEAKDMFIAWEFDVTDAVHPGGPNRLEVRIASSVNYARQFQRPPFATGQQYNFESLYIRRPRHTYGWDIAPRIIGAGLWREVHLETLKPERWGKTYLYTWKIQDGCPWLVLDWSFFTDAPVLDGFEILLRMSCGDSRLEKRLPARFVTGLSRIPFPGAKLWWPLGYGEQPLYDVTLELWHDGVLADTKSFRAGIRDITLDRTETISLDGHGEFRFIVNGEPVFVKGSNWVPSDAIHGERPERVPQALALFRDLGCNMVRCWGGNIYEGDDFFDLCDEYGIMVWQDFMGACEVPPQDEWYLKLIAHEEQAVVEALRQHPSLALWCGDNDGDEFFFGSPGQRRRLPSANVVSRQISRHAAELYDPARDYLPCSPYLCDELKLTNTRYRSPEQHLWGPRDNHKNPFYKDNCAIFASEIGYHGMPCLDSIKSFLPEASWNGRVGDPGWNCHAAQPFGDMEGDFSYRTQLMINQVDGCFGEVPEELPAFIEASQIVQAEAMKFFVESFRQKKWKKSGIIWWNVIDCWPQFSDAVVDYYYRRKLAYYYIRNAQQQLHLSFAEPASWCIALVASNDAMEAASGSYRVIDLESGAVACQGDFRVGANAAAAVTQLRVSQGQPKMYVIEWTSGGRSFFNHYCLGFPPVSLKKYHEWLMKLNREYYHIPELF